MKKDCRIIHSLLTFCDEKTYWLQKSAWTGREVAALLLGGGRGCEVFFPKIFHDLRLAVAVGELTVAKEGCSDEADYLYKPQEITALVAGKPGKYPQCLFSSAPESRNLKADKLGKQAEKSYLNIVGGLLALLQEIKKYSTQDSIIMELEGKFKGVYGLSKSTLSLKFPKAKASLKEDMDELKAATGKG